jgi:hypothetical protein
MAMAGQTVRAVVANLNASIGKWRPFAVTGGQRTAHPTGSFRHCGFGVLEDGCQFVPLVEFHADDLTDAVFLHRYAVKHAGHAEFFPNCYKLRWNPHFYIFSSMGIAV